MFPRLAYHNNINIDAIADRARLVGRAVARALVSADQGQHIPFTPEELFAAVDYSVDGMELSNRERTFALYFALREALREAERLYRDIPGEYDSLSDLPPAEAVDESLSASMGEAQS